MERVKDIQGQLLRYFRFGSTEDGAKDKVRSIAKDLEFLGIPIREYSEQLYSDANTFNELIMFSDMRLTTQIRENIEEIKNKQEYSSEQTPIPKDVFQTQYISHLQDKCKSRSMAIDQFKKLAHDMKALGCPMGDNLNGIVIESARLGHLQAMSGTGVITKLLELVDNIQRAKQ